MTHDIQYPASAKKPQLVDIFLQQLKPQARKLLAARDRVRRTSKGITDMPSSQEGTVNGDNDDGSSMPPPPVPDTPRQRRPRKSGRVSTEDDVPESPAPTSSLNGRRSSSKHARQSDSEIEPELPRPPTARKSRKSEAAPKVKVEEPDGPVRPPMRGSAFSDENPFQSGSSPLAPEDSRRKSAGSSSDRKKRSTSRRRTEGVPNSAVSRGSQEDGAIVPTSKTFEMPVSRLRKPKHEANDAVEAGEEFAPEEQLELIRERAANGEADILPRRRIRRSTKSSFPRSAPWVVLATLLAGYATWYRQEKLAVGYCGIGRPSTAISGVVQIPEWASILEPTCEPCPQHAICYEDMKTSCDHDFILQPHPLALGGLVPLPPTCEPDGEKVRRVKTVADRAVETLRERKAQAECGTLKDAKGKDMPVEIDEEELKKEVGKNRKRGMGEREFEDLWKGAIGEILGREEVVSSSDGYVPLCSPLSFVPLARLSHIHENCSHLTAPTNQIRNSLRRLTSTSLTRLPITCAIRRSARLTLARHRITLSCVIFLLALAAYARNRILNARSDTARVPTLVATTLDRLATQAAIHARGDAAESWISVGQLRDDVLRDEFSDSRRESMWTRVRAIVERNANVRASVREGRGGDVSRVWEWIGSVGLLDEPWSGNRRSGGGKRVSFGGVLDEGTPDGRASPLEGARREMVEQRKWDEGRPIY